MDDAYCLFVTLACILTLVMPSAAQPLLALVAGGLALAAALTSGPAHPTNPPRRQQRGVPGP